MSEKQAERDNELAQERFTAFGEGKTCVGCMFAEGSLGWEDPLEKEMTIHSSTLA